MLPIMLLLSAGLGEPPHGLTLSLATDLARTALDICAREGAYASASVVDAAGNPLVVLRSERSPKPPVAAPRKAAAAVYYGAAGTDMEAREAVDPSFAAEVKAAGDRFNVHAGSVPIRIRGVLAGGLAIADIDHIQADRCVRAALVRHARALR